MSSLSSDAFMILQYFINISQSVARTRAESDSRLQGPDAALTHSAAVAAGAAFEDGDPAA